ncbi:MAG: TrbC/VirB2 family protein [Betaproteobacteria bacterium]
MNAIQPAPALALAGNDNLKAWAKAALFVALLVGLMLFAQQALATDGTEFSDAATKFESWIKGNLGKLAAFVALAVGSVVAAVRKDWSWFFGAMILSIGVGILVGVVNASFTATI